MPRSAISESTRMNLRITAPAKARLLRAAALRNTNLTGFVTEAILREAEAVIEAADRLALSERDSLKVLDALERPPELTSRLLKAIRDLPPAE